MIDDDTMQMVLIAMSKAHACGFENTTKALIEIVADLEGQRSIRPSADHQKLHANSEMLTID